MQNIYFIGGSPCSGKSSVSAMLAKKHGFAYYRFDSHLTAYMTRASKDGKPAASAVIKMTQDEIWLREPSVQCREELDLYDEFFEYALADIEKLGDSRPIIAEGAGFLPTLIHSINTDQSHFFCFVPTTDFQINEYKKRSWVGQYLSGCSYKQVAFDNWMERDRLFALAVLELSRYYGYSSLVVNGRSSIEENLAVVEGVFQINEQTTIQYAEANLG